MAKPCFTAGLNDDCDLASAFLALPPEQTLAMPRQALHAPRLAARGRVSVPSWLSIGLARLLLITGTAALSTYGIREMYGVMTGDLTLIQWVFLVLFAINFTWISFAGCQAVLGFLLLLKQDLFSRKAAIITPSLDTAILLPVYNEDPVRVAAAINAMADELARAAPGRFTFFILSDTTNPAAWLREEQVFRNVIDASPSECHVYYRHRRRNTERKAGNIADWVMRWGGAYETMLVLDADSVMSPATMIRMACKMESDGGLGLLQSLPSIVMAETLYARLQQFANRLYGPVFANGLAAWHGNSSNFWGHNAIIRTAAFAAAAHLPVLKGKPPFGGHVISHDFIEAALLRRAGWKVQFDTALPESYEEAPPSVSDVLVRDRRWCQGNLQHSRFLFARGLAFLSRVHILSGIMAYMSAVFWLLLLVAGLVLAVQASFTPTDYFPGPSLFPVWPVFDSVRAITLFIVSMQIVLLPKALAWLSAMLNLRRCLRFGGPIVLTLSVLTEILLSALFAPVMMVAQSQMVREIFTGSDSGWKPQRRSDGSITLGMALQAHRWHMLMGLGGAGLTWYLHPGLFMWMLPVTTGLVLSALLSWISGKKLPGKILGWLGILSTPEERRTPPILDAMHSSWAKLQAEEDESPLTTLLTDARFRAWHNAQVEPDAVKLSPGMDGFDAALVLASAKADRTTTASTLEGWLSPVETLAFLHSPALITDTARRITQ